MNRLGAVPGDALDGFDRMGRGSTVARGLRRLAGDPAERRSRGAIVCEGIHLFQEAVKSGTGIEMVLLSQRILRTGDGREIARQVAERGLHAKKIDDDFLGSLVSTESHQGVLFVAARPRWSEPDILTGANPPRVLVASGIQDPGNLGALARIAEASSCSGIVCAGAGTDPFAPRALRAAAGSLFRLPVLEYPDAASAALALKRLGLRLLGASPRASTSYIDADLGGAFALFVGSEGAGLPGTLRQTLDAEIRIPLGGGVESLNVAAAAAIILFEAASARARS